jgi:DNA-binding NarL/FixJ family response regulator
VTIEAGRVSVHIATTQEVVAVGLRTILEAARAPFAIAVTGPDELDQDAEPDVVLYDVIHIRDGDTTRLEKWLADTATTVIAIDRTLRPELGTLARQKGVEWGIDLGITAEQLVEVIREAVTGTLESSEVASDWEAGGYLGAEGGLSRREAEVLRGVVAGRTNQQIADALFISINSVKTYIRSAYRKIGVENRSMAVVWALQHGFPTTESSP